MCDPATLLVAFDRVAGNRGAKTASVDSMTVAPVDERIGVRGFLEDLRAQLKSGVFRPLPIGPFVHYLPGQHDDSRGIERYDAVTSTSHLGMTTCFRYDSERPLAGACLSAHAVLARSLAAGGAHCQVACERRCDRVSPQCGSRPESVVIMTDDGVKAGRRRDPQLHAAALAAALQLMNEVGFARFSMDVIAQRTGMSKATLYRWWPAKSHLIIEAMAAHLGPPLIPSGDTAADLRALVAWTVNTVAQSLGDIFLNGLARDLTVAPQLENLLGPHRAAHAALLLGAAGRGDLPYDLDVVATLDVLIGIAIFRRKMQRPLDATLVDQLTSLLVREELPRTRPEPNAG